MRRFRSPLATREKISRFPVDYADELTCVSIVMEPDKQLLNEREAARFLNVSVAALRKWRHKGKGPQAVRLGRRMIRYPQDGIVAYLDSCERLGGQSCQK